MTNILNLVTLKYRIRNGMPMCEILRWTWNTLVGGFCVIDREKLFENWKLKRQGSQLKYVLTRALRTASSGLAGVVVASIFLYNSPSAYSFRYYLPTYLAIFFGVLLIATLAYTYQWNRNVKKFKEKFKC